MRRFFSDTLANLFNLRCTVEPEFDVTFGKTDYDFVDIYVHPKKEHTDPQDDYDFCNKPAVFPPTAHDQDQDEAQ